MHKDPDSVGTAALHQNVLCSEPGENIQLVHKAFYVFNWAFEVPAVTTMHVVNPCTYASNIAYLQHELFKFMISFTKLVLEMHSAW